MHGFSKTFRIVTLCLTLVGTTVLPGCSETQRVPMGECGNRILEDGEDCDGGSNCNAACRFTCEGDKTCPGGWGCDKVERICRTGTGQFKVVTLATDTFSPVQAADFDGDGRDELLTINLNGELSTVYYFGRNQSVERSVNLPAASAVSTADLTADGVPDILLSSDSAVSAFRSVPTPRTFSPIVGALAELPAPAKLLSTDLNCDGRRDILLLGGKADREKTLSWVRPTGAFEEIAEDLDITATQLLELENADVDSSTSSPRELVASGSFASIGPQPCGMLALPAPPGQRAVDVYASRNEGLTIQRVARVEYSRDEEPPKRWFFSDMDLDGIDDLVIAFSSRTLISHGSGDGTFDPFATQSELIGDDVLAAGELDREPGTDFFHLDSYDAPQYYQARALDLTGDPYTDVAAVGPQHRIDLFRGHQTGLMSLLSVPLGGVPRIEDQGDFDGDGATDLLVSEARDRARDDASPPRTTASILFAPVTSATAGAIDLATFEGIQQMAAGYLRRDARPDASQDIGVLFRNKEAKLQLGFLEGGADRLLRSRLPTGLTEELQYLSYIPAIGHFHSPNALELALVEDAGLVFYGDEPAHDAIRIELLTVNKDGISYGNRLQFPGLTFKYLYSSAGVESLDLDADGIDEIYVATEQGIYQFKGEQDTLRAQVLLGSDSDIFHMVKTDANGDGRPDLAVLTEQGLRIWTSSANGGGKLTVTFPASALPCSDLFRQPIFPQAEFAFVQADSDPSPELISNCPAFAGRAPRIDVYDVDWTKLSLTPTGGGAAIFTGGFVTGDFNGDGVTDVAGGDSTIAVLFGIPR